MFNYSDMQEEEKYTPFKLDANKKAVLSMQIKRKDKSTLIYPYSHTVMVQLENQGKNEYSLALLGGGWTATLYFKNFNDELYEEFCEAFADHKIRYIFELPENSKNADYPHFTIEVESLIRR